MMRYGADAFVVLSPMLRSACRSTSRFATAGLSAGTGRRLQRAPAVPRHQRSVDRPGGGLPFLSLTGARLLPGPRHHDLLGGKERVRPA